MRSPQTVPPDEPAPVAALAGSIPSQFHSFPIGLQSSPSVPLLPSPPLMPPANFTLSPLGASPTAPFWPSPPTLTQQSFNLSHLTFSPSGPIFPSPPPMSPASFTFSPFAAPEGSWSPCSTHLELRFALCRKQNSRQPPPPLTLPGTPSSAATALAFLIRQDVQFSLLDTNQFFPGDPTTEHQGILANLGGHQIAGLNIYIPPCTCCPAGF